MSKRAILCVLFSVLFALTFTWAEAPKTSAQIVAEAEKLVSGLSVSEARSRILGENFTIIDVREKEEFVAGAIKNAVNIPRGVLEFSIDKAVPDRAAKILVYCKKGARGALAARTLETMGYTNVFNLLRGFDGWVAAELPTVKP